MYLKETYWTTNSVDPDQTEKQHYENTPIQIYWKFHLQKLKIFR